MYRDSAAVAKFMGRVSCRDYRAAVGMIALLKEMDDVESVPDAVFWGALGGKLRGIQRETLIDAYTEYLLDERRAKDRDRQRRRREMSRLNSDTCHVENVTEYATMSRSERDKMCDMSREMSRLKCDSTPAPSFPSPAPLFPPSPPAPPVTPYNPPNPNPNNPTPIKKNDEITATSGGDVCARLGINSAWEHSERARAAAAQRIVDWIVSQRLPLRKDTSLFDSVLYALENRIPPETIIQCAQSERGENFSPCAVALVQSMSRARESKND